MYTIYLLECADGSLYTGITTDIERRFREHRAGTASSYTRAKKAKRICALETAVNRSLALKREAAIKKISRAEKIILFTLAIKQNIVKPKVFKSAEQFRDWLMRFGAKKDELWLGFYKKDAGISGIPYAEALDEALCFGWIDGIKKTYNSKLFQIRFTPRRPKSVWSLLNREHVARLTKAKRMMPAGLEAVKSAKADGRWQRAYAPASRMNVPTDLAAYLKKDPEAASFFAALNQANRYAIVYRLQAAKRPETRTKRLAIIISMLRTKKTFH